MKLAHHPRPWSSVPGDKWIKLLDANGKLIARLPRDKKAKAYATFNHIVHCVNKNAVRLRQKTQDRIDSSR